ncbi:voltage-gated chloride channel family protein [Pedobacter hartonius]|uniref:H+/Cl-antiporter ClcA n=1 Tax=Pedobacter hartonius TaxID=425514 RepID=A0A1H4BH25_9SPHI|nr:voltage-gated chloride channel family protein [Pedobacter hartonius]SEA47397.1 H+/Cl-antiporter ClcA [Pedobacter hartonius]
MKKFEHYSILKQLIRWIILVLPIAIVTGSIIALFLWLLNLAIHYRFQYQWLLFFLPAAGIAIYMTYNSIGKNSEKGNNLIIEEIHQAGAGIPKRMAPVILTTTVITHLFGGSAGREGTAVQIGGSIAGMFGRWFRLNEQDTRVMLTAGIAAGFGAVFGTPLTGAIFALEVLTIGSIRYNALFPALVASVIADITVAAWGIHHTAYHIDVFAHTTYHGAVWLPADLLLVFKVTVAAIAFGLASFLFSGMVQELKVIFVKVSPAGWMVPVIGGLIIIGLTYINGKQDYLSLGVDPQYPCAITIPSAFHAGGADTWSWLWKTVYTTTTLASGFKGGEVTPLFYIGATLGNTLAQVLDAPVSLFAALGFIAVFAGATNTPLACTFMGIELFGGEYALLFAIACFTAYFFSGHSGIYSAQTITVPKFEGTADESETSPGQASRRRGYLHSKIEKYRFPGSGTE